MKEQADNPVDEVTGKATNISTQQKGFGQAFTLKLDFNAGQTIKLIVHPTQLCGNRDQIFDGII
ncbi:MAG: hypothetical protein CG438_89 [Methylococcaceae bacterium NSP1-1]|jgi:hypothetical protein|nr:MAG: hypothetical protein CG438_89 [Methylococcaceae bacterium NSP1-1]